MINSRLLQKSLTVIPAKAGIQSFQEVLDPDFRRDDGLVEFCKRLIRLLVVIKLCGLIRLQTPDRTVD